MVLLVAAAAAAGCGGDEGDPIPSPGAGGERWQRLVSGLPDRVDPKSANVCGRGAPACVDLVVAEMQRRLDPIAAICHHAAPFALMYLRVTEGVWAPGGEGLSPYLSHLDARFAELYFDAIDAWRAGDRDAVPEAWKRAFEAAEERRVGALGDMMLGMNAHISRDLPFALERGGLRAPGGRSAKPAFDSVNALLGDVQAPMLREQARRFDPAVADTTLPALDIGVGTFAELMARWRTEAFVNGRRLLAAQGDARDEIAAGIERAAAGRARLIESLTSNLVLGPGAEEREAHCEAQN